MDIQQTLLLPSQESLVQRLEHIASYSEQLVLVSGANGSGKTTLVTALASELDNYNSALVICPMHAESDEIRRKILVQLISSPIFDDALPLADTLLRIQSSLTKPLHIIIDDAHYMPRELWAECLVLTQLKCAGKPISITFTIEPDYLDELSLELTENMQALLLHVEVEPLSLAEREGLYRTLLIRSNKTPFIPREIVQAQIEKQSGTPTEVIELLKKALDDKPEEVKTWPRKLWLIASLLVLVAIAAVVVGIYLFQSDKNSKQEPELVFLPYSTPISDAQRFIEHYGESLVMPAIKDSSTSDKLADDALFEDSLKQVYPSVDKHSAETLLIFKHAQDTEVSESITSAEVPPKSDIELESESSQKFVDTDVNQDVQVSGVIDEGTIGERDKLEVSNESEESKVNSLMLTDKVGYTLQIASVRDEKSLQNILSKLASIQQSDLELLQAKYKTRHIVLFGQFDSSSEAEEESDKLQQTLGLSAPWVRKWSDLKGYEIKSN